MLTFVAACMFLFVILFWGMTLLECLPGSSKIDRWIFGLPVGTIIFGVLLFLGNYYLHLALTSTVVRIFAAFLFALSIGFTVILRKRLKKNQRLSIGLYPLEISILIVLALVLVVVVILPTVSWDAFVYHLPYAKTIFDTGYAPVDVNPSYAHLQYAFPPALFYFFAGEWLFSGQVELVAPRIIHFFFLIPAFWVVYKIATENLQLPRKAAVVSILFLLSVPTLDLELFYQNTDLPQVFLIVLAVKMLLDYLEQPTRSRLITAGGLLGLCCWIKYPGVTYSVAVIGAFALVLMIRAAQANDIAGQVVKIIKNVLIVGLVMTATFLPFMIRNMVEFGNPVYPLLGQFLGGYQMDPWTIKNVLSWSLTTGFMGWTVYPTIDLLGSLPFQFASGSLLFPPSVKRYSWLFIIFILTLYIPVWAFVISYPHSGDTIRFTYSILPFACLLAGGSYERIVSGEKRGATTIAVFSAVTTGAFAAYGFIYGEEGVPGTYPWLALLGFKLIGLLLIMLLILQSKKSPEKKNARSLLIQNIALVAVLLPLVGVLIKHGITAIGDFRNGNYAIQSVENDLQEDSNWIEANVPKNNGILTFEARRYFFTHAITVADQPKFRYIYEPDITIDQALDFVCGMDIRYIYLNGWIDYGHPLFYASSLFMGLDSSPRVHFVYQGSNQVSLIYKIDCP